MAIFLCIPGMVVFVNIFPACVYAETLIDTDFGSAAHSALAWYLDDARFVKILDIADGLHAYLFESSGRSVAVLSTSHSDTEFRIPQQEDVYAADLFGNPIAPGAVAGDTLFYLWTSKDIKTLENLLQTTEH